MKNTIDNAKEIEAYGWEDYSGVGVREFSEIGIKMYPNPASDYIMINSEKDIDNIKIVDVTGKTLVNQQIATIDRIDVSNFAKGIYIVSLYNRSNLVGYSKLMIK